MKSHGNPEWVGKVIEMHEARLAERGEEDLYEYEYEGETLVVSLITPWHDGIFTDEWPVSKELYDSVDEEELKRLININVDNTTGYKAKPKGRRW